MSKKYDFSELMQRTRAVEVEIDRPYRMLFNNRSMAKVEARAGKPFLVWLKELEAAGNDMAVGDMYYVAWCGFAETEPELTLEEVEKLPLPVIQAIFMGPVLEALYGYGEASKN